jgi:hypothetical protein
MPIPDHKVFEALSGSGMLTSMITPAVLISACGTLIFSTSARLARIFDRVQMLKGEVEAVLEGKLSFPEERMKMLKVQTRKQRVRAWLIQKAMAALYTATVLFVASSLAIAVNVAYGTEQTAWIPSGLALLGGLFLLAASVLLLYESRYNLRFIERHIDFIAFLEDSYEKEKPSTPPPLPKTPAVAP